MTNIINSRVIITVQKDKQRGYGYELSHNQRIGFKGITGQTFAWYRLKKDATKQAEALMKCWNNLQKVTNQ